MATERPGKKGHHDRENRSGGTTPSGYAQSKETGGHSRARAGIDHHRANRALRTVHPKRIVELFALGTASGQTSGRSVPEIVEASSAFPISHGSLNSAVVRKSIARGIKEKFFGYVAGAAPALGADCRYQVAAKNVRFDSEIAEDEIDLDGGFLMIPEAIPQPEPCSRSGHSWIAAATYARRRRCRRWLSGPHPEPPPAPPQPSTVQFSSMLIDTSCMRLGRRWPTSPISAAKSPSR